MPRCLQCGRLVSIHQAACDQCTGDSDSLLDSHAASAFCELGEIFETSDHTETEPDRAKELRRVPIARFQSGAEAGYFADELARESEMDIRVLAREHFDAVHGIASTDFLLLVPENQAKSASQALRMLVAETDDGEPPADADDFVTDHGIAVAAAGPAWVPILLTLAAGSIAYWGVEKVEQRPRPPALVNRDRRQPPGLWQILGASPDPWVQKLGPGPGVRRLQIDPRMNAAVLQEDRDGDGRFEREWEFTLRENVR